MKKYIICFLLLAGIAIHAQQHEDIWVTDFELAKTQAKEQNKNILMYFTGSDWCKPCKILKVDLFDTPKFQKYAKSYVMLKIDIPRNQELLSEEQRKENFKILKEYNTEGAFPLLLAMSKQGKVLDQISGYSSMRDTSYHYKLLDKFK